MTEPRYTGENVAVVIPALNEELRIRGVVQEALAQCRTVIVIDDGSDDGTVAAIADLPVTLLRHRQRMGKGASLRDGFAEAIRQGKAGVVTMDGDGQHSGLDIPRLIAAANRHPDCLVNGARLRRRSQQPLYRRIGNDFGDWGISWGCGYRIRDTQSGQRFYPARACALDDIPGEDFVYEAQMLISCARELGLGVVSVPIEARYKSVHSGESFRRSHFRPLRDLWRITSHVASRIWAYGEFAGEYRRTRANPPRIDDVDGVLGQAHPQPVAPR
ncbi:MAG: glycosyltransferase family 2 protein [Pseudoxanthomonas suwonensis]|nr:glycosyltransferase family 2 protein [Pseudoxanthomonas suwonensis]